MRLALLGVALALSAGCFLDYDASNPDGGLAASGALGDFTLAAATCDWNEQGDTNAVYLPDPSVAPRAIVAADFEGRATVTVVSPSGAVATFTGADCSTFDVTVTLDDPGVDDTTAKGHAYLDCASDAGAVVGHLDFDTCEAK